MIRRLSSGRPSGTSPDDAFLRPPFQLGGSLDGEVGVGCHGKGDVPEPAFVAPYLAVIRAALVLRGLEGFLDRPASACCQRSAGRGWPRRACRRCKEAISCGAVRLRRARTQCLRPGWCQGRTSAMARSRIRWPWASAPHERRFPLVRQTGDQFVDAVVHVPTGNNGVVSAGRHHMEDVRLLQPVPPGLAPVVRSEAARVAGKPLVIIS